MSAPLPLSWQVLLASRPSRSCRARGWASEASREPPAETAPRQNAQVGQLLVNQPGHYHRMVKGSPEVAESSEAARGARHRGAAMPRADLRSLSAPISLASPLHSSYDVPAALGQSMEQLASTEITHRTDLAPACQERKATPAPHCLLQALFHYRHSLPWVLFHCRRWPVDTQCGKGSPARSCRGCCLALRRSCPQPRHSTGQNSPSVEARTVARSSKQQ
jgi:hypothetical protein